MSVGNEELKIVASSDLGKIGAAEPRPALVEWRWYDSKPTLPLWILLGALMIVPRENRKWQVWLIVLLPVLAVTFRWLVRTDSAEIDLMLQLVVTFVIAWASVWLLASSSASRGRLASIGLGLAVMLGVGTVGYLSYFGLWADSDTFTSLLIFWLIGSVGLLVALTLSGMCSRGRFHPGILAAWLLLWLPLLTTVTFVIAVLSAVIIAGGLPGVAELAVMVPGIAIGALMVSGFLYAVNLPVLLLAWLTDEYRERLQAMVFRASATESPSSGGNPFQVMA